MKTYINIHINSLNRLFNDKLITADEYKRIMNRIVAEDIKDKRESEVDG